jgi:peptidoglycan/LPS O-acetylase OafA/YrhL
MKRPGYEAPCSAQGSAPVIYDKLLPRLTRRTTSGRFIAEIDGLRFVAIVLVVLFHLRGFVAAKSPVNWPAPPDTHPVAQATEIGHYGVQLFFIISGFVLALPFATRFLAGGARVSLRAYFMRRLTRLEPPYIIVMTLFFVALASRASSDVAVLGRHYLASLFYVHNAIYETGSLINVVAWSLEIEVQFYVLAPLLGLVFALRPVALRRGVIIAAMTTLALVQREFIDPTSRVGLSLLYHLQFFLAGFLLADVFLVNWKQRPTVHWSWDLVALVACLTMIASWAHPLAERLVFPLAAVVAYMGAFRGPVLRRALTNPWITVIGGMCYTIYLVHYPLISMLGSLTASVTATRDFGVNLLVQSLMVTPVLLVVSALYFALIERPCMERDWPRQFAAQVRAIRERTLLRWLLDLVPIKPGRER